MSVTQRASATDQRNRFWTIQDNVPDAKMNAGCDYCERGWVTGPGLVYRCQCNPGEPYTYPADCSA